MRHALAIAILALTLAALPAGFGRFEPPQAQAAPLPVLTVFQGTIEPSATLARLLNSSLTGAQVLELVEAARPVHDLARLAVGAPWQLALTPAGDLAMFSYGIDELRTLRVARQGQNLMVRLLERTYETRLETAAGSVQSSLFGAVLASGESEELALGLAEIFAWDVDFNTELQKGDSFRVAVEKRYLDGRFMKYGRIVAAEFVRGERRLQALHFEAQAGGGYYTPEGTPLRKAFLRSPLKFSRITSGFTHARFHPILGRTTPHLGIDFGAPTGTPVMAAADGLVTHAGWMGGYGNTVRLRHANGFETLYGHLSRVQVRAGERVRQGEFVGKVGSTGLSTGPHLDYRMTRNGTFVNPLRVQLPPAEPIADSERATFESERTRLLARLPSTDGDARIAQGAAP